MPSIAAHVTNLIFRLMPQDKDGETHDYVAERERNAKRKPEKHPKGVKLEEFELNGFPADRITKEGNDKGLIFYIHGGGFTTGSAIERRMLTYHVADHYGYDCISINYRLAPENKWPSQIEDCCNAYEKVLDMGYLPKDIVFMGESAGGTLALSLALLCKEKKLPQPKAIIAFSPATDQYRDLPSHTRNIKTDHMLKDAVAKGLCDVLFEGETDREKLKEALLSPYYGDYEGLPPIFLSASSSETLYDDAMILYDKLKSEGHETEIDIRNGVCHAYQIMPYMQEARKTLEQTFAFVNKISKGEIYHEPI
ncbi:MAG: alpha/beta hydrolase [Erysipelotrichaceae bacterium]|nr:alpha/beta hydrolase [Erysipelotrichaceae bacterium]